MDRMPLVAAAALALSFLATPMVAAAPALTPMMGWSDAQLAQRVLPATVNITVQKIVHDETNGGRGRRETFFGSGFIINPNGIIVTNRHVIDGAVWISIGFADGSQAQAQLIAACALTDIAVLEVDVGHKLPYLTFGDSDRVEIGDPVLAVGNPLGIGASVSAGIVSALHRNIMETPFDDDIQTDAAINHGNSGGPLINRSGKVIGINTALYALTPEGGSIGIGYAIPSDEAAFVVGKLLDPNAAPPGWIGVHLQNVTSELARAFGLPQPRGFIVTGFDKNSPARTAGLESGDIILRFGDLKPPDTRALLRDILVMPLNQYVPVTIWRNGQQRKVSVQVRPWPNLQIERGAMMASAANAHNAQPASLGFQLAPITDAARKLYSLAVARGVVVTSVNSESQAYDLGVAPGDVILKIDDTAVTSPDQVENLVDAARARGRVVAMLVGGKRQPHWITLYLGSGRPATEVASRATQEPQVAVSSAAP
jgi:serine protease Do